MRTQASERTRRQLAHASQRGRQNAAALEEMNPGWVVLYGLYTQRLWAYPAAKGLADQVLSDTDPLRLQVAIREASQSRQHHTTIQESAPSTVPLIALSPRGGAEEPPSPHRHGHHPVHRDPLGRFTHPRNQMAGR